MNAATRRAVERIGQAAAARGDIDTVGRCNDALDGGTQALAELRPLLDERAAAALDDAAEVRQWHAKDGEK